MTKLFSLFLIAILLLGACIRTSSKKDKKDKSENELTNFLDLYRGKVSDEKIYHPKDTIDFNAIEFSEDSLDLALFNMLVGHESFSDAKIIENIKILTDKGANPNAVIEYQYSVRKLGTYIPLVKHFYKKKYRTHSANSTSFLEAVNTDNYKITEAMILMKSDVNKPSKSEVFPIDIALRNDNEKIIDLLLENGCKAVFANLSVCDNIDLIEKMVKLGSDSKTIDINFAIENKTTLIRVLKLKPNVNNSELDYRIVFANEEILDILLEAGLNNTARGNFPDSDPLIFGAIKYGDLNTIKKLKEAGIDIMYKNDKYSTSDSPFLFVVKSENVDLIKYYIEQGADPNEKDWTKKSALIFAVSTDNDEIIKLLIDAGANKEYSGYFNKTPLMQAVDYDKYISAQALINEGANVNYKSKYGESCLMKAIEEHNFSMIKLLVENGANPKMMYKKMNMTEYAKSVDAPNMIIDYLDNESK